MAGCNLFLSGMWAATRGRIKRWRGLTPSGFGGFEEQTESFVEQKDRIVEWVDDARVPTA
jgi:hypothetical protein